MGGEILTSLRQLHVISTRMSRQRNPPQGDSLIFTKNIISFLFIFRIYTIFPHGTILTEDLYVLLSCIFLYLLLLLSELVTKTWWRERRDTKFALSQNSLSAAAVYLLLCEVSGPIYNAYSIEEANTGQQKLIFSAVSFSILFIMEKSSYCNDFPGCYDTVTLWLVTVEVATV